MHKVTQLKIQRSAILCSVCLLTACTTELTHQRARVLSAAVPEDGSIALTVQPAHGEAALVQSALPTHCALALPSPLQRAVRLRGRAAATRTRTDDSVDNHSHAQLPMPFYCPERIYFYN